MGGGQTRTGGQYDACFNNVGDRMVREMGVTAKGGSPLNLAIGKKGPYRTKRRLTEVSFGVDIRASPLSHSGEDEAKVHEN